MGNMGNSPFRWEEKGNTFIDGEFPLQFWIAGGYSNCFKQETIERMRNNRIPYLEAREAAGHSGHREEIPLDCLAVEKKSIVKTPFPSRFHFGQCLLGMFLSDGFDPLSDHG